MQMRSCVICKSADLRMETIRQTKEIDLGGCLGKVVFVHPALPALVCQSCNEAYMGSADLKEFELRVALELSRRGLASGLAFKFMRKAVGLNGKAVAEILKVTPETVSRWENGAEVPATMFIVLADLAEDDLLGRTNTRDRLAALQKADRPSGEIELRLPEPEAAE